MTSLDGIAKGVYRMTNLWVTEGVFRGVSIQNSEFVTNSFMSLGKLIFEQHEDYSWTQVYRIGEHDIILSREGGHESLYSFRSSSDLKTLVRVCVDLVTSQLNSRRLHFTPWGELKADASFGEIESNQARRICAELEAEFATGAESRTLLLYGPPGSGKSSMARQIAARFSETSITIDGSTLNRSINSGGGLRSSTLQEALELALASDAEVIIVDDYDRRIDEGQSIAFLNQLRQHAKLIIYTANSLDAFSLAERRPGRMDKEEEVKLLDLDTARLIAPDLPDSIAEKAHTSLLAGYLQELSILCRSGRDPETSFAKLLDRQQTLERV